MRKSFGRHPQVYYNGEENNTIQDIVSVAHRNRHEGFRGSSHVVRKSTYLRAFRRLIDDLIWPSRMERFKNSIWLCSINPEPEFTPYLFELMPGAKMLYLVRNGIDVIASRQKYEGFKHGTFKSHCEVWKRSVRMAEWVQAHPEQAMVFRYEWLMNPEVLTQELAKVFTFFGVKPDSVVAQNILSNRYHPTSGGKSDAEWKQASENERKQLLDVSLKKWQAWSLDERAMFEAECKEGMDAMGYAWPKSA